jgi:thymidine kinase
MAKLYFRYGTVNSAKTLNLLAVAHNYRQQQRRILLFKPAVDTRCSRDLIKTRAGLEAEADLVVPAVGPYNLPELAGVVCILVDEAQFLPVDFIDRLHSLTVQSAAIPVICYGLRTDFRQQLFPAAQRLLELADTIEEIKTTCHFCLRKAVFNLKLRGGQPVFSGPSIELGFEDKYVPVCATCYTRRRS